MSRETDTRTRGCCAPVPPALPEAQAAQLANLFKAAGDPTRVQMLHMLQKAAEPICVCDFTQAFGISQPTVSHHLGRLLRAGLVQADRHGIWTYYTLRRDLSPAAQAVLAALPR